MKTVAQLLRDKQSQTVHTVRAEATVLEALQLLAEHNVGALPVVDQAGELVGVVSERDYARKVVLRGRSSVGTPVSAIMSSPVITVTPQQSIQACMDLMTERHLRHLPVIDGGKLVGLLSIGDLVKAALAEQTALVQQLERYIRGEV
jgi:CBS domain-containing protein